MKNQSERGAIVVEATLSLTAFIFSIFIILSLVNICYIQSRMSIALNSAAKEISQYSYLYYKLGIDDLDKSISDGTQDSKQTAQNTIDGVGVVVESLSDSKSSLEAGDFDKLFEDANAGLKSVESLVTEYSDKLREDPKGFIVGMGKMAASELKEEGKALLGQVLAKTFMGKNLQAFRGDDPNRFLQAYRVVDGMAGLDFEYSALMAYGTSNEIQLCVTYDVSVIKLLGIDFTFTFRQLSRTCAWGEGVSSVTPSVKNMEEGTSLWDLGATERGKVMIKKEKENYTYTANTMFDAYNNQNGANEFVTIMTMDPASPTYQKNPSQMAYNISNNYRNLASNVGSLGEDITVLNQSGAKVSLKSPKSTRTYKIVVIVPDNADMSVLNSQINKFKESWPDENIVVEINKNYGHPSEKKDEETT